MFACWVFIQVDSSFLYSDFLLLLHYSDCFLILPALGQEGIHYRESACRSTPSLLYRDFEEQCHNQGGKEKGVLVGRDEDMPGLVGKQEQREGELGSHSTCSMAGMLLACLRVAMAEGWRGSHRPVTCSEPWGVLGEGRAQGGVTSLLL